MANWIIRETHNSNRDKTHVAVCAIRWFLERYELDRDWEDIRTFRLNISDSETLDCWGELGEARADSIEDDYTMSVAVDQSLRNFIATIMHEMIHVLQWERDDWESDGEEEAENLEYQLTDEYWKSDRL